MSKFRATFDPQFQGDADPFVSAEVGSYKSAKMQLDLLANYTLHLHNISLMPDYTNYGFIEEWVDGRWVEFEEDI